MLTRFTHKFAKFAQIAARLPSHSKLRIAALSTLSVSSLNQHSFTNTKIGARRHILRPLACRTTIRNIATATIKKQALTEFRLDQDFVDSFKPKLATAFPNAIAAITYRRTYSRTKDDGTAEEWHETLQRVVEGAFQMQKEKITSQGTFWDEDKAKRTAMDMFNMMFEMKFLPPGRGLWAMGSPLTRERKLYAALNNCGFVSTKDMWRDPVKPFLFMANESMLGVGIGFDVKGAFPQTILDKDTNRETIKPPRIVVGPNLNVPKQTFVVPDSREGWVQALKLVLESYFNGTAEYEFDTSLIRKHGTPIKGFGGKASGPGALIEELKRVRDTLDKLKGKSITITAITDIMNIIGRCVIAGNVRRTAQIAMGPVLPEYLDLKNYSVNPHRAEIGWASNNSVFVELGQDYSEICKRVRLNGEPGFAWLDHIRKYSRMNGIIDNKDYRAMGSNPCVEQTLESFELCCLGELFITRCLIYNADKTINFAESISIWKKAIKVGYLYTKTVTLGSTEWPETNEVMGRNRRIGLSVTGITEFVTKAGLLNLVTFLEEGYKTVEQYDKIYSGWFQIPQSIKKTSVKPSGTISLLAGVTPGVHFPESEYYIRRIRLAKASELIPELTRAGYHIEPADKQESDTVVVSVPIKGPEGVRTLDQVSVWEQLQLTMLLQKHWADNQVSSTVTFDPKTEGHQLEHALNYAQFGLKGISFLPRAEKGAYKQMPYEAITREKYLELSKNLKPLHFASSQITELQTPERFCNNNTCEVKDT